MDKNYKTHIEKALKILNSGGTILYPTDTIWGLGCDATNTDAVKNIYNIKEREDHKSILLVVDSPAMIEEYVKKVPGIAQKLIAAATEPLTIIYPDASGLAGNLIAPDGSIGIRICQSGFCRDLIREFSKPLVSTSANISGMKHPDNFESVDTRIKERVDYVCKVSQHHSSHPKPSSIIKIGEGNVIRIIRK